MGLQVYTNPDEVDAENAAIAAAKIDRAAAQRRSAIRREPSIRPGRDQSSPTGLPNILRNRHDVRQARMRGDRDSQEPDVQIEILEAELERLRRIRGRSGPRRMNQESRARLNRHIQDALNDLTTTTVSSDVFLTPVDREAVPEQHNPSDSILLPRPTRESNLRFELDSGTSRPLLPRPRHGRIPSPPRSVVETSRGRPVDEPLDTWETTSHLSRDFAPARAARDAVASTTPTGPIVSRVSIDEHHGLETPPPESYEGPYHPLRRVAHMSPRPLPRNTVDGLGDRHRSPSPAREEDIWSHLLTTMDNADRTHTASTSFASTSDLLSATRSHSQNSGTTQTAASSFGEIGMNADETCDLPPGITEDDVRPLRERHQRQMGRVSAPRRYIVDRADHHYDRVESTGSSLSILLREAHESRERRQRRRDEITVLQAIADRHESHEEIPEEWWVVAGFQAS